MFENYTELYPLHKSLRFELIPNPKTKEVISEFVKNDIKRSENYKKIKVLIDDYYRYYMENVLSNIDLSLSDLEEFYKSYDKKELVKEKTAINDKLRKQISKILKTELNEYGLEEYSKLFGKADLPLNKWLKNKLEKTEISEEEYNENMDVISSFKGFITYFSIFKNNRDNMFSEEDQATSIANRTITVNLTKYCDNIKNYEKISRLYPALIDSLSEKQKSIFKLEYYNNVISQSEIEEYNTILGRTSENIYEKGINQIINEYIQKNKLSKYAIKSMDQLYSQILSEKRSIILESIDNDLEVFNIIKEINNIINNYILSSETLFKELIKKENYKDLYINSLAITDLSQKEFSDWNVIRKALKANSIENKKAYSFEEINESLDNYDNGKYSIDFSEYFNNYNYNNLKEAYKDLKDVLTLTYIDSDRKVPAEGIKGGKGYYQIQLIKKYLDEVLEIVHFYKPLYLYQNGEKLEYGTNYDEFYETFNNLYSTIKEIEISYNKIRNYLTTKKTFSTDKIREFLNCSSLLTGWSNKFKRNECSIYFDGKYYYLVDIISNDFNNDDFDKLDANKNDGAYRVIYKSQALDNKNVPRLFIRSKGDNFSPNVKEYDLPINDVIDIYDKGMYKTSYKKVDEEGYKKSLAKLIDYFKLGLSRHKDYKDFSYKWKDSNLYESIDKFYKDSADSCYIIEKQNIDFNYLLELEAQNKVLVFKIYNKDFSEFSKGNPNLHTLYFKSLFDNENINRINNGETYFKLNGGAALFYRESSLERKITHPKQVELTNKNPLNTKKTSKFEYDLIKNKRYTEDKMFLHFPISINVGGSQMTDNVFNMKVNANLYKNEEVNIIGIDRGERHLLYYTIINQKGEILEQGSFNSINSKTNKGFNIETDYHSLLDNREKQRNKARKEWGEIEQIKDLKDGFMSNVIYELSKMMIKYNAVVVLEKLNQGFTNSRKKVEKQVYQKFEKAFIDKLNYLVFKDKKSSEPGSVFKGYQLTNPMSNLDSIGAQNGFLLYVNPSYTSKICPKTGFINYSLDWSYYSVDKSKEMLNKLDSFSYDNKLDCFKIDINFKKYVKDAVGKTNWSVYTFGKDRSFYSDKRYNTFDVTEIIKNLLEQYKIEYKNGNNILDLFNSVDAKYFFESIMNVIKIVMRLRYSTEGTGDDNDYILSPIMDKNGEFFDSRKATSKEPRNADANGAYNIAMKGLYAINHIDCGKIKGPDKKEWLEFRQQ